MLDKVCKQCTKHFSFRGCPTDVATGRGTYCSRSCVNKSLYQSVRIYCQYCNQEIVKRRRLAQRYCSKKCSDLVKKGVPLDPSIGRKISEKLKGKKPKNFGITFLYKGEGNCKWKGGVTKEAEKIRKSEPYKQWRTKVFKRDKYTCVHCFQVGGKLEADHIKPFSAFPKLRFKVSNGRTLCHQCHVKTETYLKRWKG